MLQDGELAFGGVVGGGHPERQAAAVDEGAGGEVEDVVQHGIKAIRLLRRDVGFLSMFLG